MEILTKLAEADYLSLAAIPERIYNLLHGDLITIDPRDPPFASTLKDRLLDSIQRRFGGLIQDTNHLALRVAAMHPKYAHLPFLNASKKKKVRDAVLRDAISLNEMNADAHPVRDLISAQFDLTLIHSVHLQNSIHIPHDRGTLKSALDALFNYFDTKANELQDADPVAFWKEVKGSAECLKPLARMMLAIPASSASVERAFSSAGILTDGRERLVPETLEQLAIIRDLLLEWTNTFEGRQEALNVAVSNFLHEALGIEQE
jgi:hypothetical protein